jgi:hypothetical protein
MAKASWTLSAAGAWLVAIAAVAGFAVSVANYFNPQSGIAGEPGTILVIASTALLAVFGWLMSGDDRRGVFFRIFIIVSSLLNIAGTGFAGYLLHSQTLLVLILAGLVGWLFHVFRRRRDVS